MSNSSAQPRILLVTPEVGLIAACAGENFDCLNFKSIGLAAFLSNLAADLYEQGADVHITLPDYRNAFSVILQNSSHIKAHRIPKSRVHLTEDRAFFYTKGPRSNYAWENVKISLAFQREVIHQVLPKLQPDLIHCHDWMSGLIPAMARASGIPCIFTLQSCETAKCTLSTVEDIGIDAAVFWQHLFFDRFPVNYEETREANAIDFLLSGIFAADFVSVAEPTLLAELNKDQRPSSEFLNQILVEKFNSGSADVNRNTAGDAKQNIDLYERMLQKPLIEIKRDNSEVLTDFSHRGKKENISYNKNQVSSGNFSPLMLPV
jgi:starch synthase/alpha-amylase